jgi:hypothetical protein
MLRTFRAVLKGNGLEWQEEVNQWLQGDRSMQVLVTILDEAPLAKAPERGQEMAAVLERLAQVQAFSGVDPLIWQREVRQERDLPGRSE